MPTRSVQIEVPELKYISLPAMILGDGKTLPDRLLELARTDGCFTVAPMLKEAARLLEALRIALNTEDTQNYDSLTDGEIAIVKGNQTIASKLDDIANLLREVSIEKRNTTLTERER